MLSRELKMLQSHNLHGTGESLPLATRLRRRKPVLKNIQTAWKNALETIEEELTCFSEQRFEELNKDNLYRTNISSRYKEIRARLMLLECSTNEYVSILHEEGYREEPKTIHETTQRIQAQVTNIKLTYGRAISVTATSIMDERREDFEEMNLVANQNEEPPFIPEIEQETQRDQYNPTVMENVHPGSEVANQHIQSSATE